MLDNPKLTIMQFRSTLKDQIHSLIQSESRSVMSNCLWPHGLYSPWNTPGQNSGVGSLSLLQEILPTQGSSQGLSHCRQILYHREVFDYLLKGVLAVGLLFIRLRKFSFILCFLIIFIMNCWILSNNFSCMCWDHCEVFLFKSVDMVIHWLVFKY